jgi:hypothetical protein
VGIKQNIFILVFRFHISGHQRLLDLNALLKERSRGSTSAAGAARATETVPTTGGAMAEKSIGA